MHNSSGFPPPPVWMAYISYSIIPMAQVCCNYTSNNSYIWKIAIYLNVICNLNLISLLLLPLLSLSLLTTRAAAKRRRQQGSWLVLKSSSLFYFATYLSKHRLFNGKGERSAVSSWPHKPVKTISFCKVREQDSLTPATAYIIVSNTAQDGRYKLYA